jgi:hypothetical protein
MATEQSQPDRYTPSTKPATDKTIDSVAEVFDRFRSEDFVFSVTTHRFEVWVFRHIWLVGLLPLYLLIAFVPLASLMLNYHWPDGELRQALHEGPALFLLKPGYAVLNAVWSITFVLAPASLVGLVETLLFRRFARNAPQAFVALADAGRLMPGDKKGPSDWRTFAERMERGLHSPSRFAVSVFFIAVFLIPALRSDATAKALHDIQTNGLYSLEVLIVSFFWPILWSYFFGIGVWLVYVVARDLRLLPRTFNLDIQPRHLDGCGGLKGVGDLCLEMAAMYIIIALLLSFWALAGTLAQGDRSLTDFTYIALIVMIFLTFLTFFVPMWTMHNYMVRKKVAFQDKAIQEIAPVEKRLRDLVSQRTAADFTQPKDDATAKVEEILTGEIERLKEQLDLLQELYPANLKYPTWPFDLNILLKFLSPQIVPILVTLGRFSDKNKTLFESIISFFSRLLGGS